MRVASFQTRKHFAFAISHECFHRTHHETGHSLHAQKWPVLQQCFYHELTHTNSKDYVNTDFNRLRIHGLVGDVKLHDEFLMAAAPAL